LESSLEEFLKMIHDQGKLATLDMEDHLYTDLTLNAAQSMWRRGNRDPGIVLQTRLHRTQEDIERLFARENYPVDKSQLRVRLCIGIYQELEPYATQSKAEAKRRLVQGAERLLDLGIYTEFATHDPKIVEQLVNLVARKGLGRDKHEFQFLLGVHSAERIQRELIADRHRVRTYVPIEYKRGDGHPYEVRRCAKNTDFPGYGARNVVYAVCNAVRRLC